MDGERFLFSLSRFGIKLGLGPTVAFAKSLGNPEKSFRSIHVAGSNGKGSTSTFIYRILKRGSTTGLYTSPHLRRFSERIIANDREIPLEFVNEFVNQHRSTIEFNGEITQLTFFEYTTLMAFDYFRREGVQFAVVEVGLGGRLDSTNIIDPEVSVITSLSLEHADKLGGSLEYIAKEKAGTIKKGKPLVIGKVPKLASDIFEGTANVNRSSIKKVEDCAVSNLNFSIEGTGFRLDTGHDDYEVKLRALGEHQVNNSISAILACESLKNSPSKKDILQGLQEDQIPGRFEIRRRNPLLIMDGAHNSEASRILSTNIRRYSIKDPLIVLGVLKDKNSYNILQNLSEVSESVLLTEPNELERKKDSEVLKREAKLFFKDVEVQKRPSSALDAAIDSGRNTVITGSLYLVGEMETLLDEKEKSEMVPMETKGVGKPTELIE
jgi:dihydrofolate synthase/folylpolyglutamate synthase